MMSQIPGKPKPRSKLWLICFKTFLYKYTYYKPLKNLLKPKQCIQPTILNFYPTVKSVVIIL